MKFITKNWFFLLIVWALLATPLELSASKLIKDSGLLAVEGRAEQKIYHGNRARARALALEKALTNAITKTVRETIGSAQSLERISFFNNLIKREKNEYLLNYRIIKEEVKESHYYLKLKATIKGKALHDRLERIGALSKEDNNLNIAINFCRNSLSNKEESELANTFQQMLLNSGVKVSDFKEIENCPPFPLQQPLAAKEKQLNQEFIAYLKLRQGKSEKTKDKLRLASEIFFVRDNSVTHNKLRRCSPAKIDKRADQDKRLNAALLECAGDFSEQLLKTWNEKIKMFAITRLQLLNLENKADYAELTKMLKEKIPRLQKLELTSFSKEKIELKLVYQGERQELVKKIAALFAGQDAKFEFKEKSRRLLSLSKKSD